MTDTDYVAEARAAIKIVENDDDQPGLMFEEYVVPLLLEVIDRLDTLIEMLRSSSSDRGSPE